MTHLMTCLSMAILTMPMALAAQAPTSGKPTPAPQQATTPPAKAPEPIATGTGLRYVDIVVGTGAAPARGQRCVVHYTGWLNDGRDRHGKKFDSSVDRGKPFPFPVGVAYVIKGWDEGVAGMKVGGKRTLFIPSYLGYGPKGAGGDIPPNADLIFDVELISLQ
jgi:peptidylprolyl isomerase